VQPVAVGCGASRYRPHSAGHTGARRPYRLRCTRRMAAANTSASPAATQNITRQAAWWPKRGKLKRWRKALLGHIVHVSCNRTHPDRIVAVPSCADLDVYAFGVFTGRSLKALVPYLSERSLVNTVWGFDSFQGAQPLHRMRELERCACD
jgi:hypothetical protein